MSDIAHHLEIDASVMQGNGGLGRYVLLPGSPERCHRIGAHLQDVEVHTNRRRHDVVTGRLERDGRFIDVAAVPTGMGCPSLDIVCTELMMLGVRRLMRVGTSGSLQPSVRAGDLVVATAAVRDEGTSSAYAPIEFPAVADPWMVMAICRAAQNLGLEQRVHAGVMHTKDSFYGREFSRGPSGRINKDYMERLTLSGVLATEMEAAHLLVLGSVFGKPPYTVKSMASGDASLRCGALCAVIGTVEDGIVGLDEERSAEECLVLLALEGLVELAKLESTWR